MADIFVSYDSDDRERIAPLVEVLEAEGFSTWWDRRIGMGTVFDREIERELSAASCVVVVWSKASVDSDWVREEASDALERNNLVPVRIDDCRPPLGFRRIQTAALIGWPARRSNLNEFLDAVRSMVGAEPAAISPSDADRGGLSPPGTAHGAEDSGKSLLVLPFENLGRDPEDDYLIDGLTEELITDLIRTKALRVVPSGSAFRLKGTSSDLATLAAELGVRYVLEGRVRRSADNVRVTVQLVDLKDDSPLWAERFAGRLEDTLEFQESVSQAIAEALQVELSTTVTAPKRESVAAVLRGRHFYRQRSTDGLHKALQCFSEVTRLDPGYASVCRPGGHLR